MRRTKSRPLPAVTNAPNHPIAQRVSRPVFRPYRGGLVIIGQRRGLLAPNRPHVESPEPLGGAIRDKRIPLSPIRSVRREAGPLALLGVRSAGTARARWKDIRLHDGLRPERPGGMMAYQIFLRPRWASERAASLGWRRGSTRETT